MSIGDLLRTQSKLTDTEEMYHRALVSYEKAFRQDYMSKLNTSRIAELGALLQSRDYFDVQGH